MQHETNTWVERAMPIVLRLSGQLLPTATTMLHLRPTLGAFEVRCTRHRGLVFADRSDLSNEPCYCFPLVARIRDLVRVSVAHAP